MKSDLLLTGCAAAVLLTAGCGPDLAQGNYGAEEQQWQKAISDSYSGYRPPRIAPPAIVDKAAPEALEKQREQQGQAEAAPKTGEDSVSEVPAPAEDAEPAGKGGVTPAQTVDSAAEKTGADAKKADDKKAGDKKADAKKADDKKAGDKKADAKKADDKKADAKKAPSDADCEIYVVKPGDNPGSIAQKFYGKASDYELILKANPQIKDPKQIPIGTKLRIPKL
ncbi:MAG: LysM peptidoglycan-binding domain-containing protein [Lentisphaeria bacterium]|nr:LysM peptidoglycan-binding domain-containing protein [Lentisphaeria bacterium]